MRTQNTWGMWDSALWHARRLAKVTGMRMRVIREDGEDEAGPYCWRILPAEVSEPCS